MDRVPEIDDQFPKWSRLDTTNANPPVFPTPKNSVFTVDVERVKQTAQIYREARFPLNEDSFQPFEGMVLRILQSVPPMLTNKFSMDDFYSTLRTERAFMGQVHSQMDSIKTPEAYKEILKLTDVKGVVQRLMIKSTLLLLAQLEALDPADTNLTELMLDWCIHFKEKLVMLFVNSFVFSADQDMLDGTLFQESLRVKSEEQWLSFAERVKTCKYKES